jgi:hypothetical protein
MAKLSKLAKNESFDNSWSGKGNEIVLFYFT